MSGLLRVNQVLILILTSGIPPLSQQCEMFKNAFAFNSPIGNWDVSRVKTMEGMFDDTDEFRI